MVVGRSTTWEFESGIIDNYKARLVVESYKQKEDVSFIDTQ